MLPGLHNLSAQELTLSCLAATVCAPHQGYDCKAVALPIIHACMRPDYQRSLVAWLNTYAATSWISSSDSRSAHAGIAFLPLVTCGQAPVKSL